LILIKKKKNYLYSQCIDTEDVAVGNGGAASTREELRDKSSYKPAM
jgi:hypothetical protein